jgi:2-polyprenyl-6-methoxyphenol hydroxylase-like FAD-dependent oxidoreductase
MPLIGVQMRGAPDTDALIIGAGPAGASLAIRLARLGWRVTLVEQAHFPRQKVCGECLGPASLELLDELGLGSKIKALAGPAICHVAWMAGERTVVAEMPACADGRYAYGCAIGRDCLDGLLLEHARSQGVQIVQPAKVRRVSGEPGEFSCVYELRHEGSAGERAGRTGRTVQAAVVIDAHGSWERAPEGDTTASGGGAELRSGPADLLAFKTNFEGATLAGGVLPVLCLPGGYGGMVVADRGRTTVACCIRRKTLQQWRLQLRGASAGDVIDSYLRNSCEGVAAALRTAHRREPWQSVGPLRTGFHARSPQGILRVGNAAAEAHPVIGEGICMALQSAAILANLFALRSGEPDAAHIADVQRAHTAICRKEFSGRLRIARLYARVAMQPFLAASVAALMSSWPAVLTGGAQLAGKARRGLRLPSVEQAIA